MAGTFVHHGRNILGRIAESHYAIHHRRMGHFDDYDNRRTLLGLVMLITPAILAKSGTESGHQRALFAWANYACWHGVAAANHWAETAVHKNEGGRNASGDPRIPCLAWMHAIPNGGSRGDDEQSRAIRGGQLKAEGVKSGVADVFLPFRSREFSGLYIEMKKPGPSGGQVGGGKASDEQNAFGKYVISQGYGFVICWTWREAANNITSYLAHAGIS
jgi:hypothetical protein